MKNILVALIFGLSSAVYSQTDYTFVYDSDAFMAEGIRLYDEEKYEDAIKQFNKIDKNDPQFYNAQYEKAISLAAGTDKEAAKAFYEDSFNKGYMNEEPSFYMAYGSFLSDQKEYENSEKMFLEALKLYPNNSILLYNLALLYIRKDDNQKSVDYLKKAITINPNHAGSHYLIGLLALEDGRVTEGTMALLAYLTLAPNTTATENAILKLNAKFAENYLTKSKLVFSKSGDNFEEIDVILRNSLPLKSAYKINSTFDDIIIRQVQAVAEYAVDHKIGDGFFETNYVPFLADIVKKKQFEGFSYYILLGMKDKLGKKITSQNKKITAFTDNYINKEFWDVFAKRKVDLFGKEEEVVVYMQNNRPYLLGKVVNGKKEGKYKILNESGNVASELNFVNDEFEGLQKYFTKKGTLREEKSYSNGKANGIRTTYYENGNIELVENYKNDVLEGISTSYYLNGGKSCEGNYANNERNGKLICFYENGTKRTEVNYSNGKLNGKYISFNKAGNIVAESNYNLDKLDGKSAEYYNGTVVKSEVEYKTGVVASPYKAYFPNSVLSEEIIYANDLPKMGTYNYPNGKKSYEIIYDKDGYATNYNYYNTFGDNFFQETYTKQGEIKTGLQLEPGKTKPAEVSISKGIYSIKDFDGTVITKGQYEKGKKKGEWIYQYRSGILRSKENYLNGDQSGLTYNYNSDSRVSAIANYVNDTINGIYESYDNGRLSNSYHYKGGNLNGPVKSFYPDGSISSESFYIDGEIYSKSYDYWQNGKLSSTTEYVESTPVKLITFNLDGKKENEIDYKNKNGKITTSYYNGNEIHEYSLINGVLNGKYLMKDKLGKLIVDCNYSNGSKDGPYVRFGPTGAPHMEINYYSGKSNGLSKHYDIVGNLRLTDSYIFGDNTGIVTRYYHNKSKFTEITQFDNNIEGEMKYYNQKGENILTLGYENNILTYYKKLDKDGKLTEKTNVVSQTANINSTYPNGKTAIAINYEKGNIDGKFLVFNMEGKPEFEAVYDMGLLSGTRIEYYANGKIYKKENFKNSDYEGLQEFFKEDGKTWLTAEYKNDELHGLCKIYNNGILSQTKRYDSDAIVEIIK